MSPLSPKRRTIDDLLGDIDKELKKGGELDTEEKRIQFYKNVIDLQFVDLQQKRKKQKKDEEKEEGGGGRVDCQSTLVLSIEGSTSRDPLSPPPRPAEPICDNISSSVGYKEV